MDYNEIVGKIRTMLATVDGTGIIHSFARWVRDSADFKTLFTYTDHRGVTKVRGWQISREKIEAEQAATEGYNTVIHTFRLKGLLSVKDSEESEIEFQKIIEDVMDAFRPQDATIDSFSGNIEIYRPIQVENIATENFGGELCHVADCIMELQEFTN